MPESHERFKDVVWKIPATDGKVVSWDGVHAALLMDIRDELKRLNALLHCSGFLSIPTVLIGIRRNMARKKRKKA